MGIARAIRRVKRQAKQGGLNAVMTGLGEGLRSRAVPAPLRGAARKIASLIDPTRSPKSRPASAPLHTKHSTPSREPISEIERGIARPPAEVTPTGVDSGAEPLEPAEGTPVDAVLVGATPTFNATPVEVQPIDATPVEVTPIEVKPPLEVTLRDLPPADVRSAAEASDATAAQLSEESALSTARSVEGKPNAPRAKPKAQKSSEKKPATAAPQPHASAAAKEKLAADGEAAKSVARSGSRTAKKPASTRADTTSKKK